MPVHRRMPSIDNLIMQIMVQRTAGILPQHLEASPTTRHFLNVEVRQRAAGTRHISITDPTIRAMLESGYATMVLSHLQLPELPGIMFPIETNAALPDAVIRWVYSGPSLIMHGDAARTIWPGAPGELPPWSLDPEHGVVDTITVEEEAPCATR